MPDPLTTSIRLTQPTVGGDSGTWGGLLDNNMAYIDQATNGTVNIPTGDTNVTLVADGSSSDQARYLAYNFTGAITAIRTMTLPNNVKVGFLFNSCTGGFSLNITTGAGNAMALPADGQWYAFNVDASGNVNATPLAQIGPKTFGRNLFHNPIFSIQQRGQGPFASGYIADRWNLSIAGGDTDSLTMIKLADSDRTGIGDEAAVWGASNTFTGSSTAGSYSILFENVESVRRLSNKVITVSFWARASSGTPKIGVSYQQQFGSGGSPSTTINGNIGVTPALSTNWTRYAFTVVMPSTSGKTLGTNNNDSTQMGFWYSCNNTTYNAIAGNIGAQSGTVIMWGFQLEIWPAATALEKPDFAIDRVNCARFYWAPTVLMYSGVTTGPTAVYYVTPLPVTMRATPTVSYGTVNYNNATALQNWILGPDILGVSVSPSAGGEFYAYTTNPTLSADI